MNASTTACEKAGQWQEALHLLSLGMVAFWWFGNRESSKKDWKWFIVCRPFKKFLRILDVSWYGNWMKSQNLHLVKPALTENFWELPGNHGSVVAQVPCNRHSCFSTDTKNPLNPWTPTTWESGDELFPALRHAEIVALYGAPPCQPSPRGGMPIACRVRTPSPLLHASRAMPFAGGGRCDCWRKLKRG